MTTTIQAAIEALKLALTICDAVPTRAHLSGAAEWRVLGTLVNLPGDGPHGYAIIREALAALQAAPAQGSIDTPAFLAMLDAYCTDGTNGYEHHYRKIVTHIDALIAQRATSGDAKGGLDIEEVIDEVGARREITDIWMQRALKAEAKLAASAPIADEVAGDVVAWMSEDGRTCSAKTKTENMNARTAASFDTPLCIRRPPAPPASAPDAPAGEFRRYYDTETCSAEQAHAYVRAARAAAARAGHAEPFMWVDLASNGSLRFFTRDKERAKHWVNEEGEQLTELFAAPVAAEPLPRPKYDWCPECHARDSMPEPAVPAQPGMTCWCATCRPITMADMRMVLCPYCGNKRCPKATDHRNKCTNSNEPGQVGSSHE